ncbi:uncharacterized protein [Dermacentor albipictus]|uniref:uncharacterized protein isoform X3 n=1 Tax=Dermacentor albipictus TaxID=60249 RepID=UPI0038FCF89E
MSSIKCTKCGHKVPSTSWMELKTDCQPKCDNDFPRKSQGPASVDPEKTTCKHCGRNVKESKMSRHLEVCYEVRAPCPYCDENVARKDMKAHTEKCMRKFEEAHEASDAAAAASGNSKKSKKTTVSPPEPHENPPHLRNNSNAKKKEEERQHSKKSRKYGLVASEQESSTTFHNTSPSDRLGRSEDEPMNYLAATKARSHSTAGMEPCRMTCSEAFKESIPTPGTSGAFNDDPDDDQESCHLKSGSYEVNEACSYKTRSSICEGKPAYYAVAEESNINPRSFAGHLAGGVPSSHQPNQSFCFETTKEDSKPNYFTGSPVSGSFRYPEVPPTLLNAQHEQNEIIQADVPGSSNTKYEMSRGISSQSSRIEYFRKKGGCVKTHDQTQLELSEGTNERQCDETERTVSELGSDLVSPKQKSYTAFQNATPSHHSGPSADEPVKYLATGKASSHSTGGKELHRMTCAEALKESNPTPTATAACIHHRDDGHESCHRIRGSYEVSESYAYNKGRSNICEDKPAHSLVSEDRKICSNAIAGHIGGGALLCRQPNKGFSTETT